MLSSLLLRVLGQVAEYSKTDDLIQVKKKREKDAYCKLGGWTERRLGRGFLASLAAAA